jgi:hypothetical protein
MRVPMIAYFTIETNTKTWMRAPKCEAPRYKEGPSDEGTKTRGGPVKVIWYFPIASRVHRLFANAKSAKLLRWHGEKHKKDIMVRHPTDGKD